MSDLISRQDAIDALAKVAREKFNLSDEFNHYLAGLMDGEYAIRQLPSAQSEQQWIPLHFDGMTCDFPYEMDGYWVIVTDGKNISVERIKKDAYDHFYPTGRWFALEDVKAWMPLPEPYKGGDE